MLGIRLSKMGQEASEVGTGQWAKGLVRLATGLDFTLTGVTSLGRMFDKASCQEAF